MPKNTRQRQHGDCDNDPELARAIRESNALADEERQYSACVKRAFEESKREAAEAESLRLAIEASLADDQQHVVAIGLGLKATARIVNSTCSQSRCSDAKGDAETGANSFSALQRQQEQQQQQEQRQQQQQQQQHQDDQKRLATTSHLLKVTFGSDVRRLHVPPSDAPSGSEYVRIKTIVENSFGLAIGPEPLHALKYYDEEGDLCTLLEDTIADFMDIHEHQASWKVTLEAPAPFPILPHGPPANESNPEEAAAAAGESPSLVDVSIATPPETPRILDARTIEEDYEDSWSVIGTGP